MKQKSKTSGGNESYTRHETSQYHAKNLLRENFSETEECKIEEKSVKKIEGTPFYTVKTGDEYTIVFGSTVVTEKKFATEEQAAFYVEQKPWELIIIAAAEFTRKTMEIEKQNKPWEEK